MHTEYYRSDRRIFYAMGQWPYQNKLVQGMLRSFVIFGGLSMLIPMLIGIQQSWGDLDTTIECIPPILISILGFIMYINGIINNDKFKVLLDSIERDWKTWSSKPEIEIIRKFAIDGNKLRRAFGTFLCGGLAVFLVMPLVPQLLNVIAPLNETRPKIPLFVAEFYIDKNKYYYWIFVHNYCTTFFFILFILIGDLILMMSVQHAAGIHAAIGARLNNIMKNQNYGSNSKITLKQQIFEDISFCAYEHMTIIVFIKDIHEFCSTAFFVALAINMFSLSVVGVQAVTHLDDPDLAVRYLTSAVNHIIHIFCLSVPCQQLINQGDNISDCIYNGNWYEFPIRSRKLLLMIMKKSCEPCQFTAGKIYTYSMPSFAAVLRTSMSYFTVLSSLQ